MKKKLKQFAIIIIMLFSIITIHESKSQAVSNLNDIQNSIQLNNSVPITNVKKQLKQMPSKFIKQTGNGIQNKFNLRENMDIEIKDQGNTNNCWIASTNTSLETVINKTNGTNTVLQEKNVEEATDDLYVKTDGMGNALMVLGYYTSGNEPIDTNNNKVNVDVDEYRVFPSIYKNKTEEGNLEYTNTTAFFGREYYTENQVEEIRNEIKYHILNYGAVTAITSSSSMQYYNNSSYYCDNLLSKIDHQITIIGWDDNYPVENFNSNHRPSKPGAYIVQNSYGDEIFDGGIMYISYEDAFIEGQVIGVTKVENKDYLNLYQHDELGVNGSMGFTQDIYGANVYKRDTSQTEYLDKIGIAVLADTKCEIYVNPRSSELDKDKLNKIGEITLDAGYKTYKLQNPIKLTGEEFAIVVKYEANEDNIAYVGIEYNDNAAWQKAENSSKESYLSTNMQNYEDMTTLGEIAENVETANLCIKAFTTTKSRNYIITDEYVKNIKPETTIEEFKNNLEKTIEIENEEETNLIKTGMKAKIDGKEYTLIVVGDIDCDGKLTLIDLAKIKQHLVEINKLENERLQGADINLDNEINLVDLSRIKQALVGLKEI